MWFTADKMAEVGSYYKWFISHRRHTIKGKVSKNRMHLCVSQVYSYIHTLIQVFTPLEFS